MAVLHLFLEFKTCVYEGVLVLVIQTKHGRSYHRNSSYQINALTLRESLNVR